jgi:tripartite-type tricarboxylate transporter receptor subunit TctC
MRGYDYGSAGIGPVPHAGGEVMARAMRTKLVHVPFRGSADARDQLAGTPIAMGRTSEPAAPDTRSGRIIVQDVQTRSRASSSSLAFWI